MDRPGFSGKMAKNQWQHVSSFIIHVVLSVSDYSVNTSLRPANMRANPAVAAMSATFLQRSFPPLLEHRIKIRLIEGNAKCRHLKKSTCKGTLRQVFICLRLSNPYPPPRIYTLYVNTLYLLTHGRGVGGEVEPERRGEGQQGKVQITQLGWKYQHVSITQENGYLQCTVGAQSIALAQSIAHGQIGDSISQKN